MSATETIIVAYESLKNFATEVFSKVGLFPADSETVASVLTWANLRGVDSHGVQLLPWYVEAVEIGHIKTKPDIQIEKETAVALLFDADRACGPVVTTLAMRRVMEKAKKVGIGWAFLRRHNHQGAMGYYPHIAAQQDMAGIAWCCACTTTAPHGAKFPGIGNNPLAISVPAKHHRPLLLDTAMSIAAGGKILVHKDKGLPLPEGWVLDEHGNPTTDPALAAILMPIAGPKGSGLSIMLECLGSVMMNFPKVEPVVLGKEEPFGAGKSIAGNPDRIRQHIQNSVIAAIDIGAFTDIAGYKKHIDNLIDGLKSLPKAEGCDEIFVPGEPEWRTYDQRLKNGIPIPRKTFQNLEKVADKFNLTLPA